jgi:hypothetical protein
MSKQQFKVDWIDSGREPQSPPNPQYPHGIDIDMTTGKGSSCRVKLPYPAKRCGVILVHCNRCGSNTVVSTAGRPDDPRSVTFSCQL